jgi:hypothetical protein
VNEVSSSLNPVRDSGFVFLAAVFTYEHPTWPWFYNYERGINKNDGFPICAVAATALGELGDPAVIPALEEAARNNPDLKVVFEIAISTLHNNGSLKSSPVSR